ncbi:MAG: peptide deformylase [bacterium]
MSILKVARLGHPVLRKVAEPIPPEQITSPEIQTLIRDMLETMVEYNGVGLAAPQVHVSRRLLIAGGEEDEDDRMKLRVFINPEVTIPEAETYGMYEGCLSVPGLRGYVERPAAATVTAYDEKGEQFSLELEGFPAVVFQHEYDHLDGILYTDRLADSKLLAFEEEAARFLPIDRMGLPDDTEEET